MSDIIIVDAGSTKSQWTLLKKGSDYQLSFKGSGINPFQESEESIINKFLNAKGFFSNSLETVSEIFYYGAGCANKEVNKKIYCGLEKVWNIRKINVESDMLGVARSLFNRKKGIACILGTGSNSCLYDGNEIIDQTPSLGFILGDEGSGAVLGKRLVSDIFKEQTSPEITDLFFSEFSLTIGELLEKVYKSNNPSSFLGSFAPFLHKHIEREEIQKMVIDEFENFFQRNVLRYLKSGNYPVSIAGSVGYEFSDIVSKAAEKFDITITKFTKSPMEDLVSFHLEKENL